MIKTLRITGIIAAVLAAVFVVFPAIFGLRGDGQAEQFLESAGVIERFSKARGKEDAGSQSQTSPLVKQAQAFALYLNPPPEMKKPADKSGIVHRPPTVSPKFVLVGTCYYALHPERSLALIDEPGKGLNWVRQSSGVGHLIIEQVKDGLIVVRDGKRSFELTARRPARPSLVKGSSGKAAAGITGSGAAQISAEESAVFEKFIGKIKTVEASAEPGQADSEHPGQKSASLMAELIHKLESMRKARPGAEKGVSAPRISSEEAKRLDHLGRELKVISADPNRAGSRETQRRARLREPNRPEKK